VASRGRTRPTVDGVAGTVADRELVGRVVVGDQRALVSSFTVVPRQRRISARPMNLTLSARPSYSMVSASPSMYSSTPSRFWRK
jgi:hypothetical protein